ncbi:MAG TPA: LPS export ABC transporter periplasmic protein LptC [Steroidobacteraceae bacterium]|nr:LPS export ABC transporter periplasmic protein LptC [Steroidobacteraceae bacterium]
MNSKWIWLVAVLGALAVSYTVLTRQGDEDAAPATRPPQPGYYLEDAVIVETGPDGKPRVKLSARVIAQNPMDDSIGLTDVRVNYSADTERQWLLTAKEGFVPPSSQRIEFAGNVEIQDLASTTSPRVTSDRLELDMSNNIARTDSPVQITYGPHTLTARGLWADLKGEKLRLESQVHGNFAPK